MNPTISIFLASSNELELERQAFEQFVNRKSKAWQKANGVMLDLHIWEDFVDAMSKTRLQDEYNKAIKNADLFVAMIWSKMGKYTEEEFNVAWEEFQVVGKPKIFTYVKTEPVPPSIEPSLATFKLKLQDLGHFPTVFKNTEQLLLHFSNQLEKIYLGKEMLTRIASKTRNELIELINKNQVFDAFEELSRQLGDHNIQFNLLRNEYIDQPNNFATGNYLNKLKVFVGTVVKN